MQKYRERCVGRVKKKKKVLIGIQPLALNWGYRLMVPRVEVAEVLAKEMTIICICLYSL